MNRQFITKNKISAILIRNKNAMVELLNDYEVEFLKICVSNDLNVDGQTRTILEKAQKRGIKIEYLHINKMPVRRSGRSHDVLVGYLKIKVFSQIDHLLVDEKSSKASQIFILINRVDFDTNIGMICRTAFAAGVDGIVFQGETKRFINEDSLHYSLGALARLKLIKMNIFDCIKKLKLHNFKVFALDMKGDKYTNVNLTGNVALVVGEEREGLSKMLIEKCDKTLTIPMLNKIDSLNVAVSTSIVLYEKIRQDDFKLAGQGLEPR